MLKDTLTSIFFFKLKLLLMIIIIKVLLVQTKQFLLSFGFNQLQVLPSMESLEMKHQKESQTKC